VGDVLILAGDIVSFALMNKREDFFTYIADHFTTVYWLPGNHEYYDADISERSGLLYEKIRENVFLVNNHIAVQGTTRFIFSTMWSAISEQHRWRIENYISDFGSIRLNGKRFTADAFNRLHTEGRNFIAAALETAWPGNTVVITHHVPTYTNYPKKYKGDSLNEVFAVELKDLIETTSPDYWIYGHHHANTPAFKIGATEMLTNQLGYVHHYEYGSFDGGKYIVV
jgi:predicted phosphohydrolase